MPVFCTCNWLCPGQGQSTCFAYTNRWLGGQLPALSVQKNQAYLKARCSPVCVGSILAGKAGWPFQPWEWHTENTSTVFKVSHVLLAHWVFSCLSLCIFHSHLLLPEVRAVTCSSLFPSSSNSSQQCSSKAQWWDAGGVFVAGESSGWKEVMLSGVRLTATLSEAQPVEQQMCPFHSANPFFLHLPCLLGHILPPNLPSISKHPIHFMQ